MQDDAVDTDALGQWLGARLGRDLLDVVVDGRPAGGFSAETILVTASGDDLPDERYVVRIETLNLPCTRRNRLRKCPRSRSNTA